MTGFIRNNDMHRAISHNPNRSAHSIFTALYRVTQTRRQVFHSHHPSFLTDAAAGAL